MSHSNVGVRKLTPTYSRLAQFTRRQSIVLLRHSREGGNPEMYTPAQRAVCFDLLPFGQGKTNWIPAFAGMTGNLNLFESKNVLTWLRIDWLLRWQWQHLEQILKLYKFFPISILFFLRSLAGNFSLQCKLKGEMQNEKDYSVRGGCLAGVVDRRGQG
jgi:hypothetical protein